jgi:hypothetical protein
MNWLRDKLRAWLIGDILKGMNVAIGVMKSIELQGLENIQAEMGSMFFTFSGKRIAVKTCLDLLLGNLGLYMTIKEDPKGELYPVIKQIRKPTAKPKLKKMLDVKE